MSGKLQLYGLYLVLDRIFAVWLAIAAGTSTAKARGGAPTSNSVRTTIIYSLLYDFRASDRSPRCNKDADLTAASGHSHVIFGLPGFDLIDPAP